MKQMDWKLEAQKNAAEAGEMKMALALRLNEITVRIETMSSELMKSDNFDTQVCYMNRISILKEEKEWIEGLLLKKE